VYLQLVIKQLKHGHSASDVQQIQFSLFHLNHGDRALIESAVHLRWSGDVGWECCTPGQTLPRIILRWLHFVAGIRIGLLYFFNHQR
jgi:hypothetical protein